MPRATEDDKLALLQHFEVYVFDLDGTLWLGSKIIPGAIEVLQLLRSQKKTIRFVTNNASKSRAGFLAKLKLLGVQASLEEVYSSSYAAAAYLEGINFKKKVYVVGEEGIVEELELHGIKALGGPADRYKEVDWSSEPRMDIDPDIGAVVVGLDRSISYFKIQYGTQCLLQPDCLFLATNTDARGNLSDKQEWAGAGTMVYALVGASEREPTVLGKPSSFMLDHIVKVTGISSNDKILIVGDRLDTDIQWGLENGAATLLVLTGVTSEEQVLKPENLIQPMLYIDSIADLLTIKSQLSTGSYCSIS
ncbi:MAG: hypothetical protein WDW38_011064 [Sanguina aurantia]